MPGRKAAWPIFRIPQRDSPHRIAATALYRALLAQCRAAPVNPEQRAELQNIVRNRFKQTRNLHGQRRLEVAFQAGYEGIDVLDAVVAGDEEMSTHIIDLLERTPEKVKQPPPRKEAGESRKDEESSVNETAHVTSGINPIDVILARPLPLKKLSGPRRVPIMTNANGIPFLRITKPQPESLSGAIFGRIKRRQRRLDRLRLHSEQYEHAGDEDVWDRILEADHGVPHVRQDLENDVAWRLAPSEAWQATQGSIEEDLRQNTDMAQKLQDVVDREQELFDREKQERKDEKRRQKLQRLESRETSNDEAIVD